MFLWLRVFLGVLGGIRPVATLCRRTETKARREEPTPVASRAPSELRPPDDACGGRGPGCVLSCVSCCCCEPKYRRLGLVAAFVGGSAANILFFRRDGGVSPRTSPVVRVYGGAGGGGGGGGGGGVRGNGRTEAVVVAAVTSQGRRAFS